MRARILPCDWLIAFAQICGIFRSTRFAVMSTDASIDEPTAHTAIEKSCAPICRRASIERESATTAWVTRSDHFCTRDSSTSTASTSRPSRSSCPAVAAPNRPRPITSTGASCLILSTNDGPLFRTTVQLPALAGGQGRGECHCTNPPQEHRDAHDVDPGGWELAREAGRQAARGEGGDDVEEHVVERLLGDLQ